jgi:hypothetical protein
MRDMTLGMSICARVDGVRDQVVLALTANSELDVGSLRPAYARDDLVDVPAIA